MSRDLHFLTKNSFQKWPWTRDDLKDFGRTAGNVGYSDVDRNTGTGYIEYGSRSDADEAIRILNNTQFNGATVTVEDAAAGAGGSRGGGGGGGYESRPRYDDRGGDRGYSSRGSDRRDDRDDRGPPPRRDERDDRRDDYRRRSVSPARRDRSPEPRRSAGADVGGRSPPPPAARDDSGW
ncbi:BQ5605_C018g08612 [Microbotryum silenes-dioicae]|uniref:BQ5605_C018g08612 protein n=1 Tax=Microbotryum silenes-dioicae TaxID=796604 RepID=A0A2X0MIB7_9BASI|nr:BQ5605_C018g08612 [Microbotryum silenes-dioicae]